MTVSSLIRGMIQAGTAGSRYCGQKVKDTVRQAVFNPRQTTKSIYNYCAASVARKSDFLKQLINNCRGAVREFWGKYNEVIVLIAVGILIKSLLISVFISLVKLLTYGAIELILNDPSIFLTGILKDFLYCIALCCIVVAMVFSFGAIFISGRKDLNEIADEINKQRDDEFKLKSP